MACSVALETQIYPPLPSFISQALWWEHFRFPEAENKEVKLELQEQGFVSRIKTKPHQKSIELSI